MKLASVAVLLLAVSGAHAQQPGSLQVSQAEARGTALTAYVYALDANGAPIMQIPANALRVTVGANSATVASSQPFGKTGEGVAYVFLVDVSKSLEPAQFEKVRQEIRSWIEGMRAADRAAIIAFGSEVKTVHDFTADKNALAAAVAALSGKDPNTELYAGLEQAGRLAQRLQPDLPRRRVAVVFSDGINDSPSGVTKDELLEHIRDNPLPIYALGFAGGRTGAAAVNGMKTLAELARRSGGSFFEAREVAKAYTSAKRHILQAHSVRVNCERCPADGSKQRLQLVLRMGERQLFDGMDVRMTPIANASWYARLPWWLWLAYAASLAFIIAGIWLVLRTPMMVRTTLEPARSEPVFPAPPSWTLGEVDRAPSFDTTRPVDPRTTAPTLAKPARPQVQSQVPPPPEPTPAVPVQLAVISSPGDAGPRHVSVTQRTIVGRSAHADVAFPSDKTMSGQHFELSFESGTLLIRDLESSNGTVVNGVRIRPSHKLEDGDLIVAGQTHLRVFLNEPAALDP